MIRNTGIPTQLPALALAPALPVSFCFSARKEAVSGLVLHWKEAVPYMCIYIYIYMCVCAGLDQASLPCCCSKGQYIRRLPASSAPRIKCLGKHKQCSRAQDISFALPIRPKTNLGLMNLYLPGKPNLNVGASKHKLKGSRHEHIGAPFRHEACDLAHEPGDLRIGAGGKVCVSPKASSMHFGPQT